MLRHKSENDMYRGADKSLARPTSRRILFDGVNISLDTSLVLYIYSTNIPLIMIINRLYENQNLLLLQLVSFVVGLRTYQHPVQKGAEFRRIIFEISKLIKNKLHWFLNIRHCDVFRPLSVATFRAQQYLRSYTVIVQRDNYKLYKANMLLKEQRIVFIKLS